MAPPVTTFPVSALPSEVNTTAKGKPVNPPRNLEDGTPKQILQYKCNVKPPTKLEKDAGVRPMIVCMPVLRLFRQFADGMTVETTAWESVNAEKRARWTAAAADGK